MLDYNSCKWMVNMGTHSHPPVLIYTINNSPHMITLCVGMNASEHCYLPSLNAGVFDPHVVSAPPGPGLHSLQWSSATPYTQRAWTTY